MTAEIGVSEAVSACINHHLGSVWKTEGNKTHLMNKLWREFIHVGFRSIRETVDFTRAGILNDILLDSPA